MPSRRNNAPSWPCWAHASASATMRRFSLAANRRRLAVATTSGSGARAAPGAPSSVALRAPCEGAPGTEVTRALSKECIPSSFMSRPACTLNCPRQVSQFILARGGPRHEKALLHTEAQAATVWFAIHFARCCLSMCGRRAAGSSFIRQRYRQGGASPIRRRAAPLRQGSTREAAKRDVSGARVD